MSRFLDNGWRALDAKVEELVEEIVARIAALPDDSMTSPPDSPFTSPWQEYAAQIQGEHSPFFRFYDDLVFQICAEVVRTVDETRRAFLWLACEDEWLVEVDGLPSKGHVLDALTQALHRRVGARAADLILPDGSL